MKMTRVTESAATVHTTCGMSDVGNKKKYITDNATALFNHRLHDSVINTVTVTNIIN